MENVSYAILVIFIFYFDFSLQDIRVKRQTTNITKCSFDLEVSQSGKLQGFLFQKSFSNFLFRVVNNQGYVKQKYYFR